MWGKRTIKFLGHIIKNGQIRPDEEKLTAIEKFPRPSSRKDLRRLLGTVNYLRKFIPNLSDFVDPFRELMKERTAWPWDRRHDEALATLKIAMKKIDSLGILKKGEPIEIMADASPYGLGAVLLQQEKPIFSQVEP